MRVKFFSLFLFLLCVASVSHADDFTLKNGEQFKGKIIARSRTSYLVATEGRQRWIPVPQIKAIRRDPVAVKGVDSGPNANTVFRWKNSTSWKEDPVRTSAQAKKQK